MKKAFLLTASPTVDGNGDALIAAASAAAKELGAQVRHIAVRDKKINFCI